MWKTAVPLSLAAALLAGPALADKDGIPSLDHIFVIMLENHSYSQIIGNPNAPFINVLASTYNSATDYSAITHPSLPNYLATIAGSTFGITNDGPPAWGGQTQPSGPYTINAPTIAGQLVAAGKTWRTYQGGLPGIGSKVNAAPSAATALYAVKHNPFPYFRSIQNSPAELNNMVPENQLQIDLTHGFVPNLAYIVPDQCNDMHGVTSPTSPCNGFSNARLIHQGDAAVESLVTEITSSSVWHTGRNVTFVVFDEGTGPAGKDPVVAIAITNYGAKGVEDGTAYNHYSLLKTMEAGLGLPYLAHAGDPGTRTMSAMLAVPEPRTSLVLLAGLLIVLARRSLTAARRHTVAVRQIPLRSSMWKLVLPFGVAAVLLASPALASKDGVPSLDHIFVIMMENHSYNQIIGNPNAPFINVLSATYNSATDYTGVIRGSLPTYLATVGGDTFGITNSAPPAWGGPTGRNGPYTIHYPTIANQLVAAGKTWRTYQEGLPAVGSKVDAAPSAAVALYAVKHNPFPYFSSIQNSPSALKNMVPESQLAIDLSHGFAPNLAYIVPNQCNDMHGVSGSASPCNGFSDARMIQRGDTAVRSLMTEIMGSTVWHTGRDVAFIVFDEGTGTGPLAKDPMAAIAVTNYGRRGVEDSTPYTQYSLLKTMEAGFDLPYLRHAGDPGTHTMAAMVAVPEPHTLVMLLAGLLTALAIRGICQHRDAGGPGGYGHPNLLDLRSRLSTRTRRQALLPTSTATMKTPRNG